MALHQLVAGSPLRTLCLLLAGKPAEVFSNPTNNPATGVNVTQPVQVLGLSIYLATSFVEIGFECDDMTLII